MGSAENLAEFGLVSTTLFFVLSLSLNIDTYTHKARPRQVFNPLLSD